MDVSIAFRICQDLHTSIEEKNEDFPRSIGGLIVPLNKNV